MTEPQTVIYPSREIIGCTIVARGEPTPSFCRPDVVSTAEPRVRDGPRRCSFCDATEDDEDLTYCHACDRPICPECIEGSNDEHGSNFCRACVEREGLEEDDEDWEN